MKYILLDLQAKDEGVAIIKINRPEVLSGEKEKDRIDWRRSNVQELSSQGHSQREIAQMLQVSNGTVNKDLFILRQQVKDNIKS